MRPSATAAYAEPWGATAVLTHQRRLGQRPNRPIRAQHRISELKHRIRAAVNQP
jgi:hypothetical protein